MNKVVLKEFGQRYLIFEILLYLLYAIVGFSLLNICNEKMYDAMNYAYAIFYVFAFISILVYFLNRRPINYETLFLGITNVIVGTYALIYIYYQDKGFILSDGILLFAILTVLNKVYHCSLMLKSKDINFFPKLAVTILLFFIGVVVVLSLYDKVHAGILIFGYYFAVFGLLNLLEPFIKILNDNDSIHGFMYKVLGYNEEVEKPVVKTVPTSKPVVKRTRRVTTKKKSTKKTSTKKSVKK